MRHQGLTLVSLAIAAVSIGACAGQIDPTPAPSATGDSPSAGNTGCETTLCCPECELVEVLDVQDGELISTSEGTIRMYGAYVNRPGEACADEAKQRMIALTDGLVRIEPVDGVDMDSRGRRVAYLFTEAGDSIDEIMVREGLARAWTQDGQHLGWFVYRQAEAASADAGCIWSLGPLGR